MKIHHPALASAGILLIRVAVLASSILFSPVQHSLEVASLCTYVSTMFAVITSEVSGLVASSPTSESSRVCPKVDNIEPNVVPTGIIREKPPQRSGRGRNSGMQ